MNKKLLLPLTAFLTLLLMACQREPAPEVSVADVSESTIQIPLGSTPGIVRVKFRQDPFATKAKGPDLSELGNCTLTRTFPPSGKWEARHRSAGLHLWYDITFDENLPLTKAGGILAGLGEVEDLEFVLRVRTQGVDYPFNDPSLPQQWHYHNTGEGDQMAAGCDVNAFRAWTIETGKPEVIVAVNDGGVDYTHEDLTANMWVNEAELNGKAGEDDDDNGFIDDIYGYSFITYDGNTPIGRIVAHDHGTHVAGTIAAVNNNGIGVSGVAGGDGSPDSGVRIMTTPTLDGQHGAFTPASIVYAADNGAVLMNCSWGFVDYEQPTPQSLVDAINYFNTYAGLDENGNQVGPMAGGLIIFAAGNDGRETEHPAMDDNVFAVAALGANYVRSYYTSFGEWVDISAPGGDANRRTFVLSTLPGNQYGNMQGSSMAAPHATGVAALIVSHYGVGHPGFTREKLIYLMQSTANKKALDENGSFATKLGAGLIDAYAALTAESSSAIPNPVTDLTVSAEANRIDLVWTVPAAIDGSLPYAYAIYYSKSPLTALDPAKPDNNVQTLRIYGRGKSAGTKLTATIPDLDFNTEYHIRICSESLLGTFSTLSDEKIIRTLANGEPTIKALDGTSLTLAPFATGALRFALSDPDGHALAWSLSEGLDGVTSWLTDDILTLTINALNAEDGKTYEGTISISDGFDTTELTFSYTILKNRSPMVTASFEDQILSSQREVRTFDLSQYFGDQDGETLTYKVTQSTTSIIVNTSVSEDILSIEGNSFGSTTLTVEAIDGRGASASTTFRVLVRDASRPVDLYPNPVVNTLNIRPGTEGQLEITVSNKAGAAVWTGSAAAGPFNPLAVDLSGQPGGTYYVRIDGAGVNQVYTIAKQ